MINVRIIGELIRYRLVHKLSILLVCADQYYKGGGSLRETIALPLSAPLLEKAGRPTWSSGLLGMYLRAYI